MYRAGQRLTGRTLLVFAAVALLDSGSSSSDGLSDDDDDVVGTNKFPPAAAAAADEHGALLSQAEWPLTRGTATGLPLAAAPLMSQHRQRIIIDVREYGAKADNRTDCTLAIKKALEVATHAPGAVVLLPAPGIYLAGSLLINGSRHLTLRIQAGATLASLGIELARSSRWPIVPALYPASKPAAKRGHMYAPILWLLNVHNVIVEGGGTIDGRGAGGWWQTAVRPLISPNVSCPDPKCIRCQESCPSRPRLFLCQNSSFVSVRGVTFHHSPFWTTHFYN